VPNVSTMASNSNFAWQVQSTQITSIKTNPVASVLPLTEAERVAKNHVHIRTSAQLVENRVTQQLPVPQAKTEIPAQSSQLESVSQTPIKFQVLAKYLEKYPKKKDRSTLLSGFAHGFRLCYSGIRRPREAPCLKTALDNVDVVKIKLRKELDLGRIVGPFRHRPLKNLQCSPLGLVPKKQPGEFRLIHHLSYPQGQSINDFIDERLCRVKYASFDEAVDMVAKLNLAGPVFMAKLDIKSAFRILPVNPLDFELLGFKFLGQYYVDRCLPMGCSISCRLFEMFSTFLEYVIKSQTGVQTISHFLDDYILSSRSREGCQLLMQNFLGICDELGVPIAHEKTEGPLQVITYLGLEIDTIRREVRVPRDKLEKAMGMIDQALAAKKMTLEQLQSLIGSLSFLCKAVSPGRAFLRRLINLTWGIRKAHHKVRINAEAKRDLSMWKTFLSDFNGVTFWQVQEWVWSDEIQLFTDSAGAIGFGVYYQGQWTQGKWPAWVLDMDLSIAALELFPIYVALKIWGNELASSRVHFKSDNEATVYILNKKTSPCVTIMKMVREIVLICLRLSISLKASHISGRNNCLADYLSRFQMAAFYKAAPAASKSGVELPAAIWNVLK